MSLFIEETVHDGYRVVWRGEAENALQALADIDSQNRLELWSKAHAEGPKGFAPMAFREAGTRVVSVSHTFRMLCGVPSNFVAHEINQSAAAP